MDKSRVKKKLEIPEIHEPTVAYGSSLVSGKKSISYPADMHYEKRISDELKECLAEFECAGESIRTELVTRMERWIMKHCADDSLSLNLERALSESEDGREYTEEEVGIEMRRVFPWLQ